MVQISRSLIGMRGRIAARPKTQKAPRAASREGRPGAYRAAFTIESRRVCLLPEMLTLLFEPSRHVWLVRMVGSELSAATLAEIDAATRDFVAEHGACRGILDLSAVELATIPSSTIVASSAADRSRIPRHAPCSATKSRVA